MSSASAGDNAAAEQNAPVTAHAPGRWRSTGDLTIARYQHTATLLQNGQVLVAGGLGVDGVFGPLASAELYDPLTGMWAATASLTTPREFHTATLLRNGEVLVAGGFGAPDLASAELYDPTTGLWAATGSLLTGRDEHTATLLRNGQVLVAGGSTGAALLTSAELYDPTTGVWAATGNLLNGREDQTATLLPSGQGTGNWGIWRLW